MNSKTGILIMIFFIIFVFIVGMLMLNLAKVKDPSTVTAAVSQDNSQTVIHVETQSEQTIVEYGNPQSSQTVEETAGTESGTGAGKSADKQAGESTGTSGNVEGGTTARDMQFAAYGNERYGFTVDYPSSFEKDTPPDNGDGQRFYAKNGEAELVVFASNNVMGETAESKYKEALAGISGEIPYQKQQDNWFAVSWSDSGRIYYTKMVIGVCSINGFTLQYNKALADQYGAVVEHINSSFQPGDVNAAH